MIIPVSSMYLCLPSSFSGSEVLYNPMDNTTYEKAINDGTVLLDCEYINNADFIVSDVTTDDMNSY